MRKLVPGPRLEPIQLPLPSTKGTPQKSKPMVELKILLPQLPSKELAVEVPKIKLPAALAPATMKMTKRESETPKMMNFEPSPWRSTNKKKKEPTPKPSSEEEEEGSLEELEEEELASSSQEPELEEEEAELVTLLPVKKKLKTRNSDWKKSTLNFQDLGVFQETNEDTEEGRKLLEETHEEIDSEQVEGRGYYASGERGVGSKDLRVGSRNYYQILSELLKIEI